MPTAFADIGTNMAKLLVASWQQDQLAVHHEEERYIRIGEGMGRTGRVSPGALERMRLALTGFKATGSAYGAHQLFAAGTSALREAENKREAVDLALHRTGVPVEILSGKSEARLTFLGACSAFDVLDPTVAVFDIGGGSTEIAIGDPRSGDVARVESLPLGCVRLTEDVAGSNPMSSGAAQSVRTHIGDILDQHNLNTSASTLIAGTATANVLADINRTSDILTKDAVHEWATRLLGMTSDDILNLKPELLKGRADVYPSGVLILESLLEYFGAEMCLVSPRRMIHGLAIRHFQGL